MIWLTWRQHRKQALFTAIALALLAALMVPTGLQMHHAINSSGLADCLSKLGKAELISHNDCHPLSTQLWFMLIELNLLVLSPQFSCTARVAAL